MDFQKQIDEGIKATFQKKQLEFHILFVSDGNSRLSPLRGATAMEYFKNAYSTFADVSVTTMNSTGFLREEPDLTKYNVLWIDNVINAKFIHAIGDKIQELENQICGGPMEIPADATEESLEAEAKQRQIMRNLKLRVIYALDEFVWHAPAGRQVNMFTVRMVEDAMIIADEIVVPNTSMMVTLKKVNLIPEDKDVVVINTFVNNTMYPLYRVNERASRYSTSIRRPKILIKGTTIPKNVQNFILYKKGVFEVSKEYKITICSVGELSKPLYAKMQQNPDGKEPEVTTIQHWASAQVDFNNFAGNMAIERDVGYDFVITTVPENIQDDPYELANADTDNILAVAEGAVTIAGVKDAGYTAANHICVASGFTFSPNDPPEALLNLIERWRICVNWDEAYKKQRELLNQKTIGSEQILGGFFHAMLGRTLSDAYAAHLKEELEKQKAEEEAMKAEAKKAKETKKKKADPEKEKAEETK